MTRLTCTQASATRVMLRVSVVLTGVALADTIAAEEQSSASITYGGHAHVMRKARHLSALEASALAEEDRPHGLPPRVLQAVRYGKSTPTEAAGRTSWQASSHHESQQPWVWNASFCNASMIGTWRFSEYSSKNRDFRVFRDRHLNLYMKQVYSLVPTGIRTGWLTEHRPHDKNHGCCFKAELTDGTIFHILLHRASSLAPETLEITHVGQKGVVAPFMAQSHLASRKPAPAVSPSSAAWVAAVIVLLSGPLLATVCSFFPTSTATTVAADAKRAGESAQCHEDWMDVLRLFCIAMMVIRHAVQSLERLGRVPGVDQSWFLHGLPIFMYISGRSFGLSGSTRGITVDEQGKSGSLKARLLDHLAFVKRRSWQLLLPSVIGTFCVVVPTEYAGRHWRTCAEGPDAPLEWLKEYLFWPNTKNGIRCEGLGWLGFMVSLFIMQVGLRPWAIALRHRVANPGEPFAGGADLGLVVLCLCSGIAVGSYGLEGGEPVFLHGFLRPDTALAFAPLLADLLTFSIKLPWHEQANPTMAPAGTQRLAALMRRLVASVALAAWTKKTPFDAAQPADNSNSVWIELCVLQLFYQQGAADAIFNSAPQMKETSMAHPVWRQCQRSFIAVQTFCRETMATWPRLTTFAHFVLCYGVWLLLSFIPVTGYAIVGAGFRYPAYCRASAGDFVMRSWIILGVVVFWWGSCLPKSLMRLKMFSSFGFTVYLLHWFFIELVFGQMYGEISGPREGEPSWLVGLVISLAICLLGVAACHLLLQAMMGQGISYTFSLNELVLRIKNKEDVSH